MKLLFDLFPVLLFFVAYKTVGIYVATAVAIGTSLMQTLWFYYKNKKFEKAHVITFFMLLIFGGLTIILKKPEFLMWKVTVINVLFALAFLGSFFIGKKTLIERMMGGQLELPKSVWQRVNFLWTILFIVIAVVNIYFILPAIASFDTFKVAYTLLENETLEQINCAVNTVPDLCLVAQDARDAWVNFKLFGTMGLTIIFVILTGMYISQYIKEDEKES